MLSLYVGSQELQETECCHYMWDHKSCKRLNVVIICGITRVARCRVLGLLCKQSDIVTRLHFRDEIVAYCMAKG